MKNALRQHLKEKRRGLPAGLYAEKSKKIAERLRQLTIYTNAKSILFYLSTKEEVDTHHLIKEALEGGKAIYLPKINKNEIEICPLKNLREVQAGPNGILEPKNDPISTPIHLDLILIPGLGFDHRGHRLGHGKGHYDRLLKKTAGYKVGLAFEEQLVPELPIEEHDVPVDALITDQNLLYFQH